MHTSDGIHVRVDPVSWPDSEIEISRITVIENEFISWEDLGAGESLSKIDVYSVFESVMTEENLISVAYLKKVFANVITLLENIQRTLQVRIIDVPGADSKILDVEGTQYDNGKNNAASSSIPIIDIKILAAMHKMFSAYAEMNKGATGALVHCCG